MNVCGRLVLLTLLGPVMTRSGRGNRIRSVRWWNLADQDQYFSGHDGVPHPASGLYGSPSLQPLVRRQRRLLARNPGSIAAIAKSAKMAVDECQHQFRNRRWNCPTRAHTHGASIFGDILRKGCRETAFIHAATSAALAHSVARACSEGGVYTCACGSREADLAPAARPHSAAHEWQWGGCSDNADFGYRFSRDFTDGVEKGRDLRYMMNLHNNEAGRLQIRTGMIQECKCHGMSGSCTLKTCWMRLPVFREVGDALKERFDGASKVVQGNSGNTRYRYRNKLSKKFNLIPTDVNHKPPGARDLVYYEPSPSFCGRDGGRDFRGTEGRQCNATSIGVSGCDLMCCGRGYTSQEYTARERCNCTFHWCCTVTCDTCTKTKTRFICL